MQRTLHTENELVKTFKFNDIEIIAQILKYIYSSFGIPYVSVKILHYLQKIQKTQVNKTVFFPINFFAHVHKIIKT